MVKIDELKKKRADDVRTERRQKAEAKKRVEDLETRLSDSQNEMNAAFELRLLKLERQLMCEKEDRERALKAEREDRNKALEEQGAIHAIHKEELDHKLKGLTEALECAVFRNDFIPLRILQVRAALDKIQEFFAQYLGLRSVQDKFSNSLAWRTLLDGRGGTQDRIAFARSLMGNAPQFQTVLQSDSAMILICERHSSIRNASNSAAHSYADRAGDIIVAHLHRFLGALI